MLVFRLIFLGIASLLVGWVFVSNFSRNSRNGDTTAVLRISDFQLDLGETKIFTIRDLQVLAQRRFPGHEVFFYGKLDSLNPRTPVIYFERTGADSVKTIHVDEIGNISVRHHKETIENRHNIFDIPNFFPEFRSDAPQPVIISRP
jgi:hypothetical protein